MAWHEGKPEYRSSPNSKEVRENFAYLKALADLLSGAGVTEEELRQLHGSGVVKADLAKLHDITSSATEINQLHEITSTHTEINQLHGSGVVKSDFEKLHAITLSAVEANLLDADNRTIGDILTKTSGGTMGAIAAVAAGNYLKSAGVAALPSYGKLSLVDTGVYVHSGEYVNDTAADTVTTGFRPSLVICVAIGARTIGERGWSFGAYDRIQNINRYIYRKPDGSSGTGTVLFNIPSCGGGFVNSTSATGYTVSYNVAERVYFVQISFP